jgi:hypothetical protein
VGVRRWGNGSPLATLSQRAARGVVRRSHYRRWTCPWARDVAGRRPATCRRIIRLRHAAPCRARLPRLHTAVRSRRSLALACRRCRTPLTGSWLLGDERHTPARRRPPRRRNFLARIWRRQPSITGLGRTAPDTCQSPLPAYVLVRGLNWLLREGAPGRIRTCAPASGGRRVNQPRQRPDLHVCRDRALAPAVLGHALGTAPMGIALERPDWPGKGCTRGGGWGANRRPSPSAGSVERAVPLSAPHEIGPGRLAQCVGTAGRSAGRTGAGALSTQHPLLVQPSCWLERRASATLEA